MARKREHKREVLESLQRASWMVDAEWSPERIAAHYGANRDHRAKIKRARLQAHWHLIHNDPVRYIQPPYPREMRHG